MVNCNSKMRFSQHVLPHSGHLVVQVIMSGSSWAATYENGLISGFRSTCWINLVSFEGEYDCTACGVTMETRSEVNDPPNSRPRRQQCMICN